MTTKYMRYKRYVANKPWVKILRSVKRRCRNSSQRNFRWYGNLGIKCKLTTSEIKFLWNRDRAYLLSQPSIDRIDPNGDYDLGNCRFIELSQNLANRNKIWQEVLNDSLPPLERDGFGELTLAVLRSQ